MLNLPNVWEVVPATVQWVIFLGAIGMTVGIIVYQRKRIGKR